MNHVFMCFTNKAPVKILHFQNSIVSCLPFCSVLIFWSSPFLISKHNKLFWADISSRRPSWWNIFQMFLLHCIFLSPQGKRTLPSFHVSQHLPLNCQFLSSPSMFFCPSHSIPWIIALIHLFHLFIDFCQKYGKIFLIICNFRR